MSSFEERIGNPVPGDMGFDETLNDNVELIVLIKTEYYGRYWIAKDSFEKYVIVNEDNLTDIGYYGE